MWPLHFAIFQIPGPSVWTFDEILIKAKQLKKQTMDKEGHMLGALQSNMRPC